MFLELTLIRNRFPQKCSHESDSFPLQFGVETKRGVKKGRENNLNIHKVMHSVSVALTDDLGKTTSETSDNSYQMMEPEPSAYSSYTRNVVHKE
jgi:hypothetical protein